MSRESDAKSPPQLPVELRALRALQILRGKDTEGEVPQEAGLEEVELEWGPELTHEEAKETLRFFIEDFKGTYAQFMEGLRKIFDGTSFPVQEFDHVGMASSVNLGGSFGESWRLVFAEDLQVEVLVQAEKNAHIQRIYVRRNDISDTASVQIEDAIHQIATRVSRSIRANPTLAGLGSHDVDPTFAVKRSLVNQGQVFKERLE